MKDNFFMKILTQAAKWGVDLYMGSTYTQANMVLQGCFTLLIHYRYILDIGNLNIDLKYDY